MSSVNDFFDKCLAECPAGAEDVLLGEIAKRVLQKYYPLTRIEVRNRSGLVAYLEPAFIEIDDLPPEQRELALRETDPNEPRMSGEEFNVWINAKLEKEHAGTEQEAAINNSSRL